MLPVPVRILNWISVIRHTLTRDQDGQPPDHRQLTSTGRYLPVPELLCDPMTTPPGPSVCHQVAAA